MYISFNNGIADNDHKGLSGGRGTKFWLRIEVHDSGEYEKVEYEYFLLDLIEGKFDKEAICKPYRDRQQKWIDEQDQALKEQKDKEMQLRKDSVKTDPQLEAILDQAISANPKAIAEFKGGKEKALNAVVGSVMKELKTKNIQIVDAAFTVNTLLKQRISI